MMFHVVPLVQARYRPWPSTDAHKVHADKFRDCSAKRPSDSRCAEQNKRRTEGICPPESYAVVRSFQESE